MSLGSLRRALLLLLGVAAFACTRTPELEVTPDPAPHPPESTPGEVAPSPAAPAGPRGETLPWSSAPELKDVRVSVSRDSAVLYLPQVEGARDYRAFALVDGVTPASGTGHIGVKGADVFCAGFRQFNLPAEASAQLLRQLQVNGLRGKTRVVVEAVDAPCPFPGVLGRTHASYTIDSTEVPSSDRGTFQVYTEAEVRARYGSLVVNGHGAGDKLGQPAAVVAPKVLARTTLVLTPSEAALPALATQFDDFADDADQPAYVRDVPDMGRSQQGVLWRNGRWSFYSYGAWVKQFFVARGQLHLLEADWGGNIFASTIAYPRKPVQLSDTAYTRVHFEVPTDATQRRYWWISMCGAPSAGATMDAEGNLLGNIIQTPAFHQDDGLNPSVEGWNCLQVFPRDGWPFDLGPDDTRPQSDVRVMVNRPGKLGRDNVVNVSPDQYHDPNTAAPSWFRQQKGSGPLLAPMLDDQLLLAPATRYDLYVRRDRVILYVNGEQRLCNDFPGVKLSMAEAALGFGQVLYHSTAERGEFSVDYFDRTGQRYFLQNTPYIDARSWDNLGYSEGVGAPGNFVEADCYVHR